jgi:hypothetical protein
VGALLGNLISNQVRQHFRFGTIAISMLWLETLMFPLYAIAPNAMVMGLVAAAEELVAPIYVISLDTYRLMATPDSMRGRMSSTVQWVTRGAQSVLPSSEECSFKKLGQNGLHFSWVAGSCFLPSLPP